MDSGVDTDSQTWICQKPLGKLIVLSDTKKYVEFQLFFANWFEIVLGGVSLFVVNEFCFA